MTEAPAQLRLGVCIMQYFIPPDELKEMDASGMVHLLGAMYDNLDQEVSALDPAEVQLRVQFLLVAENEDMIGGMMLRMTVRR